MTAVEGDSLTLELIEENPSGEVGFEGTVRVSRTGGERHERARVDGGGDSMTSASGRGQRPIRVGNCSGFYGDRASAMADMARAGGIDVLTGDYLAEVTMLILGKARAKDSSKGYATTFLQHLDAALEHLVANGIRLVVNAGGLNPAGLAAATRELIARHGHDLRVSHIEGDDVYGRLDALQQAGHSLPHLTQRRTAVVLAASAADGQRVPGRVRHRARPGATAPTSSSPAASPTPHWSSVPPPGGGAGAADDYDALAGAVCAGHVIECGPQATGGNFSGFRAIADLVEPGFPIAEIAADGSSVITKNPGTGGAVTQDTVTAQLVYEIGEPAYLNPDVTTHLDTATLTDLGDDRVQIRGVRGSAPPATTKVAITAVGGWENSVIFALTGTDLDAKAALVERSVHRYIEPVDGIDAVAIDRIGTGSARSRQPERGNRAAQDRRAGDAGGRRARVLVADGRAGAVQLPRVVRPRPSPSRVGVRRLLARTARPGDCSTTPSTTTTARPRPIAPGNPHGAERRARPRRPNRRPRHRSRSAMDRRRARRRLTRRDRARPLRRQGRRRESRRLGTRP